MQPHAPAGHGEFPLMVQLAVAEYRRAVLARMIEGELAWQTTVGLDPLLPTSVVIADGSVAFDAGGAPVIALIDHESSGPDAAAILRDLGTAEWVAAPVSRSDLAAAVRTVVGSTGRGDVIPQGVVSLAGAAGGVGTTTVALALGGLLAWSGRRVLAIVDERAGIDAPVVASTDLDGPSIGEVAAHVPALPLLQVVRRVGNCATSWATPPRGFDAVVVDQGRVDEAAHVPDILVGRRDRATIEALRSIGAGCVAVHDAGALSWRAFGQQSAHLIRLPHDARIAKATAAQRVPVGLPGRWLKTLNEGLVARRESFAVQDSQEVRGAAMDDPDLAARLRQTAEEGGLVRYSLEERGTSHGLRLRLSTPAA